MKFYQTDIWGFSHALRSLRNPTNSWRNSDTKYLSDDTLYIGPSDIRLIKETISSNQYGAKFLKQIFVSTDIIAPLNWWKEFDEYAEDSVSVSCSPDINRNLLYTALLEKRTVTLSYMDIRKLLSMTSKSTVQEWNNDFRVWAISLPYAVPMIFDSSKEGDKH